MTRYFLLIITSCFIHFISFAQEVLPAFTVKNTKGKISISWQNKYNEKVKNISIQRSYDSLKNFSTLLSVTNPSEKVNGFWDSKPPYSKMFYKLFIVFDSGTYIFTVSQKPEIDPNFNLAESLKKLRDEIAKQNELIESEKKAATTSKANRSTIENNPTNISKTNNESTSNAPKTVEPPPIPKKEVISYPSKRVFVDKENNVNIILPDYKSNKYVIKFFDDNNKHLFDVKNITEGFLILEKVNFRHAGWFFFEIYEDGGLFEKNKLFIPKD